MVSGRRSKGLGEEGPLTFHLLNQFVRGLERRFDPGLCSREGVGSGILSVKCLAPIPEKDIWLHVLVDPVLIPKCSS